MRVLNETLWVTPTGAAAKSISRLLSEADDYFDRNAISLLSLPFYKTFSLCRIRIYESFPNYTRYIFVGTNEVACASGDPLSIYSAKPLLFYKVNIKAPIELSAESVEEYVYWYHRLCMREDESGYVRIVDHAKLVVWEDGTSSLQEEFDRLAHLPKLIEMDDRGNYIVQATFFAISKLCQKELPPILYQTRFRIEPNGIIEEVRGAEEILMENLPSYRPVGS